MAADHRLELMKGGEHMAQDLQDLGEVVFHNHNVLNVVSNGQGEFLCVRANDNEQVTDTKYWMALIKGRDGRDGKDGKDGVAGAVPTVTISNHNTWVVNGQDTGKMLPQPSLTLTQLTSGTLGELSSGRYEVDFSASDAPTQSFGILDCEIGPHYAKQTYTVTGDTGSGQGNVYMRTRSYDASSWDPWRQLTQWN